MPGRRDRADPGQRRRRRCPYPQITGETVNVGAGWKRYFVSGVSNQAFAAGKARIGIQLAGAKQVIEVGPAFLLDLGAGFDRSKLPHN